MITIVDYQMGNLRSVQKAFERTGHEAHITSDPKEIASASKLVLPGVGACGDAVDELRRRDLVGPIKDQIEAGTPFLGICLGLQMLFDVSYEGGEHEGLGILPGEVVKFDLPHGYKVPHMGWNRLDLSRDRPCPLLEDLSEEPYVYFVHSYYAKVDRHDIVYATTEYGEAFPAVVGEGHVFGTQFHPEKSQIEGIHILRAFGDYVARESSAATV